MPRTDRGSVKLRRLPRLFWEAFDRAAYVVTDARLWLFEVIHGPAATTPADEQRKADRERLRPFAGALLEGRHRH